MKKKISRGDAETQREGGAGRRGGVRPHPGENMIERYTGKEMGALWGLDARYAKWLEVEIAVCGGVGSDPILVT